MSKLVGNQEFNGDVYVKGVGGYDGTNATASTVETIQAVLNAYVDATTAHTEDETIHITQAERTAWNSKASAVQADWNTTATTDASYIKNKPTIPTVPTSNTAFTNDAGYITGYTETDPTVPAWAKASSKPTYTASEVGALPTGTTLDNIADGTTRKLSNYATTANLNNLSGGTTAHTSNSAIHGPTGGTNGQILMMQDGVPAWVTPSTITYSSTEPTGGNDGDIWVQTS